MLVTEYKACSAPLQGVPQAYYIQLQFCCYLGSGTWVNTSLLMAKKPQFCS